MWDYTPQEILLTAKAREEQEKNEMRKIVIQAHTSESFSRVKKLPKLHKLLKEIDNPSKSKQTKGDMVLRAMAREKGVIIT